MTNYTWLRLYHDTPNDRKFMRACRMSSQPKTMVLGFWSLLLCMASDSPERGRLLYGEDVPVTDDDIERESELDPIAVGKMLETFLKLGMLSRSACYEIANWDKRQFKSDNSAARVAKHRAKKERKVTKERKKEEDTDTYTEGNVTGNVTETLHNTEYIPPEKNTIITMQTTLSGIVKTPLWDKTREDFRDAAEILIGWDATDDLLSGFQSYWDKRVRESKAAGKTYPYPGKPALKSLLEEWGNYAQSLNGEADADWMETIPQFYEVTDDA